MVKVRTLPPLLAKKAKEELNEDPNIIEESITLLREWILKQPHIKGRMDDQFLLAFLRWNKFSVERTKERYEAFYVVRNTVPELFKDRDICSPLHKAIYDLGTGFTLLKPLGEDGPMISLIRSAHYDPQKYHLKDIIKVGTYTGDIAILENDNLTIAGHIQIMDLADVTPAHFFQMEPMFLKKLAKLNEVIPVRNKGIHFINTPPGFETIFNLFKSFMNEKNKNRLFVHGSDLESLYKHVPKCYLPIEYGGENGTIPEILDYWKNKFPNYRDYFIEENQYGIDEKLREGPAHGENLFGVDGTFRQLAVD